MRKPPLTTDENKRLDRLGALGLVYSPAEERFDRITRLTHNVFTVPVAMVTLLAEKCNWFKSAQGTALDQQPRELSFCAHAILHDGPFVITDARLHPDFADNPEVNGEPFIRFYAGQPIMYEGSPMGTLCIIDFVPRQLQPSERETLGNLAKWVESELRLTALSEEQIRLLSELEQAKRQSMIDPLTKLWNRYGMEILLEREISGAERCQQAVAVMMIDVDHFKAINDSFGHLAGDIVLREVAQRIRSAVRPSDVVVRYGGDEFLVMARDCSKELAAVIGERILMRVMGEPVAAGADSLKTSVTIGIATTGSARTSLLSRLMKSADGALYDAKTAGRGCARVKGV
jgi:diguanylate cyclase (GGDEF)-like protein